MNIALVFGLILIQNIIKKKKKKKIMTDSCKISRASVQPLLILVYSIPDTVRKHLF